MVEEEYAKVNKVKKKKQGGKKTNPKSHPHIQTDKRKN